MLISVYDAIGIMAELPKYFNNLSSLNKANNHKAGNSKTIVGKVFIHPTDNASWFIVRHGIREQHSADYKFYDHKRNHITYQTQHWYAVARYEYIIASVDWHSEQITEHDVYGDKQAAIVRLRELIGQPVRPYGGRKRRAVTE